MTSEEEIDLVELEERVDSMDRGLAATLFALGRVIGDIETVIDPRTAPESKAASLVRIKEFSAQLRTMGLDDGDESDEEDE